ncbi:uncharacterized protein [Pocillopora verrucosa]|uniref:uncharacterized protein n=1 Tax=Pocillopora verrucosa TaxID=203993 RepID=UPI003341537F
MNSLIVVYFMLFCFFIGPFSKVITTVMETSDNYEPVRLRRGFGFRKAVCGLKNGVYLEKWDRIDFKRVKFLLADERFPNMPSFSTCVPTFEQPSNWGDFFGSRLRTYFVPLQTGNHYFFLSSNAGSELFMSTNDNPKTKTMITYVDGGFPTGQYEYDRFLNQKSLPIRLIKGKYYYMEAIFKDDHQKDHLEVGLETPNGLFYKVIPSMFLWTEAKSTKNATALAVLIKTAARAGAAAGLSFGAKWASKSGANAGAKAGAMAGVKAGASAGAEAGEQAAIRTIKKALEDSLNLLHGDSLHKFNIIINNGSVTAVTGPGMGGLSTTTTGEASAGTGAGWGGGGGGGGAGVGVGVGGGAGSPGMAGTAGASGTAGIAAGVAGMPGFTGGGAAGGGAGEVVGGGAGVEGGGGSISGAGGGVAAEASVSSGAVSGAAAGNGAGASGAAGGGGIGSTIGGVGGSEAEGIVGVVSTSGATSGYSTRRVVTYIPKAGEDPQTIARALVWKVGAASKIVDRGLYSVHSYFTPYTQENGTLNFCWRSLNGDVNLDRFCHVFRAHIPGLYKQAEEKNTTVSFESVCLPGYFVRQKNYHFILQKRDGSELFDKDSSFTPFSVMKYTRNLLLQSFHNDWYMCQTPNEGNSIHKNPTILLDFYNGDPDVLARCTFLFHPIAQNENKLTWCKNVLGPVEFPSISGQPLPHPPFLIPPATAQAPALPSCIPLCPPGTEGGLIEQETSVGPLTPIIPSPPEFSHGPSFLPKMCVAVNFINKVGSPFKLYSSLKHEGYLVIGPSFKLKLIINRPELHSQVTFYAEDLSRKQRILLNERLSISKPVVADCPQFEDVFVTAERVFPSIPVPAPQPASAAPSPSVGTQAVASSSSLVSAPPLPAPLPSAPVSLPAVPRPPPQAGVSAAVPANPVIPGAHLSPVFMCPVPATPCIPDPHPPVSSVHVPPPPGQTNAPSPVTSPSPPEAPNVLVTTSQEGDTHPIHYHYHYHGPKAPTYVNEEDEENYEDMMFI